MKIVKTNRARQSGTTLIELSVVIAVILLLVGVLFVGITAWRNNANRAACLVNLASLQKAVRSYQNSVADQPAVVSVPINALVTNGYFATMPTCPQNAAKYAPDATAAVVNFPAPNNPAFTCANAAAPLNHAPGNTLNW
jgi:type II secretory pathway pseudopilin PulG